MSTILISNLCRLCASQDVEINLPGNNVLKNISKRKNIISLIGKYLKIKVTDNKGLPQNFCSKCIQKLESFDSYSKRCNEVQKIFIAVLNGSTLSQNFRSVLPECDVINKLSFSLNKHKDAEKQSSYDTIALNSDQHSFNDSSFNNINENCNDDIEIHNNNDGDSNNYDDETPLICRKKKVSSSYIKPKRKRGRPKKVQDPLKVPPLKIKAVKSRNTISNADNSQNECSNTKYEIHDDSNKDCSNNKEENVRKFDSENVAGDEEFDNCYYSDDSFSCSNTKDSQRSPRKNPFTLFEFKCNTCQEVFKNFSILKRHCKKEHSTSAFVNCVCGKQLRARTAIIEHRRKHTGTSLYKCDTCGKTFNRRSLMCLHMISHMPKDEQPYVCCKCAKRFHTSSLLKKHEKVHLPEEERFLDVCNICQKKFTSKSAVNAHLRAVHYGEKPFVCEHCGNSFSSKAILTDHLTTHSSYAPWPCSVCGRNFKSKYRLNVHMDMHRSVKYRCPHCPMELSTRRTLRMHLLVHKEEKAYVCKVCSKAFRRSKDLKNHSNLHTGRRPYKCEFCERTFANGSNCRAHKLRMHPEELGVEKNCRNIKQPKTTNNVVTTVTDETNKLKNLTVLTDAVKKYDYQIRNQGITKYDFSVGCQAPTKYEFPINQGLTKYEFPASSQELEYSLDYARYTTPLNLNVKKPFMQQPPNINHLSSAFTTDSHTDVSKMHHFLSYT